jgi:hypothetical protein
MVAAAVDRGECGCCPAGQLQHTNDLAAHLEIVAWANQGIA